MTELRDNAKLRVNRAKSWTARVERIKKCAHVEEVEDPVAGEIGDWVHRVVPVEESTHIEEVE